MPTLIITVDCEDPSDLDWLRTRVHAAVEERVDQAREEHRLDGNVAVSWEIAA